MPHTFPLDFSISRKLYVCVCVCGGGGGVWAWPYEWALFREEWRRT